MTLLNQYREFPPEGQSSGGNAGRQPRRDSYRVGEREGGALSVSEVEMSGHTIPCTGAMCLPAGAGKGSYNLLVYGPRFPEEARGLTTGRYPVVLVVGSSEEERRVVVGWGTVRSLKEEGPGYVLRLSVKLEP